MAQASKLALLGGPRAVNKDPGDMFKWPIVTGEDERAVLRILREGLMSDMDETMAFEKEFGQWIGKKYALATNNGTSAIQSAMFACGVGVGDEIICPSLTFWASALQCYSLGATVVFCEVDPETLCLDPEDVEKRISDRTKAIVAVHYVGYPADMDRIMDIAERHKLRVIEDVSHAQGGLYKGRKVGTFDVGAMSLMTYKSFAIGEAGILVTDDQETYERAVAWGHYRRFDDRIESQSLSPYAGLPMGGYKYRMHQMSAAVGRTQLAHYDERIGEVDRAMNYFWDLLEGVPGIRPHRPPKGSGSTMGGWYAPRGRYVPEELEGLSVTRFTEAVRAEGVATCVPGTNKPLHLHPLFNEADIYGHGKPTRIANSSQDMRQPAGTLPVSEKVPERTYVIPWFKLYRPEIIEQYADAYRKAAEGYKDLLAGDEGNPPAMGGWFTSTPTLNTAG